jgi:hypothetical protein
VKELKAWVKGIPGDAKVIAYCRIGECSSHTWFVPKYLSGFERVCSDDGLWNEWGNTRSAHSSKRKRLRPREAQTRKEKGKRGWPNGPPLFLFVRGVYASAEPYVGCSP